MDYRFEIHVKTAVGMLPVAEAALEIFQNILALLGFTIVLAGVADVTSEEKNG